MTLRPGAVARGYRRFLPPPLFEGFLLFTVQSRAIPEMALAACNKINHGSKFIQPTFVSGMRGGSSQFVPEANGARKRILYTFHRISAWSGNTVPEPYSVDTTTYAKKFANTVTA